MTLLKSVYDHRIIQFLVHSNIYLALAAGATAFITMVLVGLPVHFGPILISFSIVLFMYNVNQFTDIEEDELNNPQKTDFVRRYGKIFLALGILSYIVSLGVAWQRSNLVLLLTLEDIGLGLAYSVLRLKEKLFFNNLIIGMGWAILSLIAGAFFGSLWTFEVLFLSFFCGTVFFINTVIFDIKDIEGDLEEGVSTFPNTYGIEFTKKLTHLANALLTGILLLLVAISALPNTFLILLSINLYVAGFIHFARKDYGPGFYGLVVDGEFIFLALVAIIFHGLFM